MKISIKYFGSSSKMDSTITKLIGSVRADGSACGDDDDGKGSYTELFFRKVNRSELRKIKKQLPKKVSLQAR